MFAVLKTGGKQYKVSSGDVLRVEKLDAQAGEKIQFNEILLVGGAKTVVGSPLVADAGVQAEVIEQIKGVKTINFVKRRRKHSSKRTKGHRQQLTLLRITEILAKGAKKSGVKKSEQITADDIASSAYMIISLFIMEPQFHGQTKEKLVNRDVSRLVEDVARDHFEHFLIANQAVANKLIEFFLAKSEHRNAATLPTSRVVTGLLKGALFA